MDRDIVLILSGKPEVGRDDLPGIIWPTQIPELMDETMARYGEREEVSSALRRLNLTYDTLSSIYMNKLSKLWRLSLLVYRENPLWLLSSHHGISCRSGRGHCYLEAVIVPLWPDRFVDDLSSLILHPFFSSRENGAFLRLALQFAAAYRCRDNPVWDISALLSEAGVQSPALNLLSHEMVRLGATQPGGAGGRILKGTATSVYERLSTLCSRFNGGVLSVEARFLLQLGTGGRRDNRSKIWPRALLADEPRDVFHIGTDDLWFLYRAADSVTGNPPSKREMSKACTFWCGHDRIPQVHTTNMKPHIMNAFRHELYLLQSFRDRMAGVSLAMPPTPMPPATMQQAPMQLLIQGSHPPQQQPANPTTLSQSQMESQGQSQPETQLSEITLGAGALGVHSRAQYAPNSPPRSLPVGQRNNSAPRLEHRPYAFLQSHSADGGRALEDLTSLTHQDQALVLLLQNIQGVSEYTEPAMSSRFDDQAPSSDPAHE
ncbi:unnamed protein product [Clonostachys rosea]|uniref:Uncharacterized protein n=1 Tax=Bionectria ochroleuca TaxID=29856 RepID=A0ABY6U3G5_BIOOC|nr:unnamed protein product [Clonostachys rosea]